MPFRECPFQAIQKGKEPQPFLPIRIINPQNGLSCRAWGLIDTGASGCAVPAYIATLLGHDLEGGALKTDMTDTANGTATVYIHSATFAIYHPTTGILAHEINNVQIGFLPRLSFVLLGVRNFLSPFVLHIDYPKKIFSIYKS